MGERIWKDLTGYEGLYKISNLGDVYSLISKRNLKHLIDTNGYVRVSLTKNKINTKARLHRLVAIEFIDNPNYYLEINHKDENKQNNYYDNLEWCSSKYNNNYGTKRGRTSSKLIGHLVSEEIRKRISDSNKGKIGLRGVDNPRSKPVLQYTLDMQFISRYESIHEAARINSFSHSAILYCCQGKYKQYKSFIWIYE